MKPESTRRRSLLADRRRGEAKHVAYRCAIMNRTRSMSIDRTGHSLSDTVMSSRSTSVIKSWHAHIYFDADSRDAAWTLRQAIEQALGDVVELGRFHERPVGPHPQWSYQIAFAPEYFARVIGWLTLNHGSLGVFIHPNTGDSLSDHRDAAIWIGQSYELKLDAFGN
jgi:aromatic ring-cleaving dioxygenase